MPDSQMTPIEVFYFYADEDERWLQKLENHLSPLRNQRLITTWHRGQIVPGADQAQDIDSHLNSASLILLLISADFLASDYCSGSEMQRALERYEAGEAHVIRVLVHPVDWMGAPFAHLQALPTDDKPLSTWRNRDAALADVVAGIRRTIKGLPQFSANISRGAPGRQQDATLQRYIDTALRRCKHFSKSPPSHGIIAALRVETVTALHSLDPTHKGRLIRFLSESGILRMCVEEASKSSFDPPLNSENSLAGIDLQGADLAGVDVSMINLARVQLQGARLESANLQGADLGGANLQRAKLSFACLQKANLCGADLQGARLLQAELHGANLIGANLENANLADATITDEQLKMIKSLRGAIMPDWSKHP